MERVRRLRRNTDYSAHYSSFNDCCRAFTEKRRTLSAIRTLLKNGKLWPWMLGGSLTVSVGITVFMAYLAINDPSFFVEKDYYKKGLQWDKQVAQLQKNKKLGWKIQFEAKAVVVKPPRLNLHAKLFNREQKEIQGALIKVVAFQNARARQPQKAILRYQKGTYQGSIPLRKLGLWVFRFKVKKGKEIFTHEIRKEI